MHFDLLSPTDFNQQFAPFAAHLPVLSSWGAGWETLNLGLYHAAPYQEPEFRSPNHIICINFGTLVQVKACVDGKSETNDWLPGGLGIFPAQSLQFCEWYGDSSFLDLHMQPSVLNQVAMELCENDAIELVPVRKSAADPLIYQMAAALKAVLESDGLGSKLYVEAMTNALSAHLLLRYSTRNVTVKSYQDGLAEQKLKQVSAYIDEYLDRDLSLAELASLVRLSPYHFSRMFKQTTGMTPHRYHLHCRIERAKQLLLQRQLSIAEIAYAVGFSSQGHLNYHFKRFVGVTPRVYLKQQ